MNTWYKFILNALFSKKREDKEGHSLNITKSAN